jgi:ATP-dependent Clp protease ATP-binding subunit ClpA
MGSPLLDQVMANPFSVVLLDEIEKAHQAVHQLFLQVFDAGVLTDAQGRHVYFSDVVVIMTANIREFARRGVGFLAETEHEDPRATLRRHFPAEFVNRIDYVGLFHDLPPEVIRDILDERVIPEVQERLRRQGIDLEVSPEAAGLIAKKGLDEQSGAREIRRVMDEEVVSAAAQFLSEARPDSPLKVRVTASKGSLAVKKATK